MRTIDKNRRARVARLSGVWYIDGNKIVTPTSIHRLIALNAEGKIQSGQWVPFEPGLTYMWLVSRFDGSYELYSAKFITIPNTVDEIKVMLSDANKEDYPDLSDYAAGLVEGN